ncbi:response regulator [Deltaproteobacteria bacterium TL4]
MFPFYKSDKAFHYLIMMLLVCFSVKAIYALEPRSTSETRPGVLDLSQWNYQEEGMLDLRGEWEFYWKQILSPEELSQGGSLNKTGYAPFPHVWGRGEVIKGSLITGEGYATYRLKIILPEANQIWAFKFLDLGTAFRAYVNGKLFASAGIVGTSKESMTPAYRPQVAPFYASEREVDVVLHISNYYHDLGGPWWATSLGTFEAAKAAEKKEILFEMFLIGSIFIMVPYHLGLFFLRRNDKPSLYFGLFCLLMALRTGVVGQKLLSPLFPGNYWVLQMKLEYLNFYLAVPVFMLFVQSVFPKDYPQKILKYFLILGFGFSGLVLVTPATVYTQTLMLYQVIALMAIACFFYVCVLGINRKREGARILAFGTGVFLITALNDILYMNSIIATGNWTAVGTFVFIFSQAYLLSQKFTASFITTEKLSEALAEKNEQLKEHAQELKRLDKLKDEFLANTSHELRTPLNGIIGIAESLLDGATGELKQETKDNLSMITQSGKRLSNLVNDILDFSKMKNQELQLQLKAVDIRSMTDIVLKMSNTLIRNKPIQLYNKIPKDFPLIEADENRIEQILINLIGNAIKFTHEGHVTVSAEWKGNTARVFIKDSGIGVPEEKQKLIFESFEQGDGSTARQYGGTGLGLSVSRKLIELHHGEITVQSRVGEGSTFIFSIPLSKRLKNQVVSEKKDPGENELSAAPAKTAISAEPSLARELALSAKQAENEASSAMETAPGGEERETILIVDDEPINVQVLVNQLKLQNYKVLTATDGYQALEILEKEVPDLVLLDIMMPRMSGYEVCQRIRQKHGATNLPVVMLTAKNQADDIVQGLQCGANDYLTKPFHKKELEARVHRLLEFKKAIAELQYTERLRLELETAHSVQEFLIPHEIPALKEMEIANFYKSASEAGGDWYNYRYRPDFGTLDIVVGDVTGHGVQAAIVTAIAESVFIAIETERLKGSRMGRRDIHQLHPSYFLELLNEVLVATTGVRFNMTCFYSVIDFESQQMVSVGAGHPPCLIWRPSKFTVNLHGKTKQKEVLQISIPSMPLGSVDGGPFYKVVVQDLQKDDVILWYTDGLLENYNAAHQEFSLRTLKKILQQSADRSAEEIKDEIIRQAYHFYGETPTEDDITLIVGKIR